MLDLARLVWYGEKRCSKLEIGEEMNASVALMKVRTPRGMCGRHVRQAAYQDGDASNLANDADSRLRYQD